MHCDIVMKGGITSGVVYPHAIDELSRTFTFKNIGGNSAGAIAACLTAAAEYRRQHDGSRAGFDVLQKLPEDLGKDGFLFSLFRPEEETRQAFDVAAGFLGDSKLKLLRVFWRALVNYPLFFVAAMLPLVAIIFSVGALWWLRWIGIAAAFVFGIALFALAVAGWIVLMTVPRNRFGLCNGDKLMTWLHGKINEAAGLPLDQPLTFGHLKRQGVNLQFVTTALTHGRPYHLPFDDKTHLFIDEADLRRMMPKDVADFMIAASPSVVDGKHELPAQDDLPVVFSVRLSMSFPVLFELVPLHAQDFSFDGGPLRRCWFIDGGLTSNFPIHFFDGALPRWPTFGLDLRSPHPAHPLSETDERKNVWMIERNGDGRIEHWNDFAGIGGYLGAIIGTMQNWRDNSQQKLIGYRDRIAHIKMGPKEGGLNLNMPPDRIEKLVKRGKFAAERLLSRFGPGAQHTLNWDNHRWVRFLVRMKLIERELAELHEAMTTNGNGGPTYPQLVLRNQNVPKTGYAKGMATLRRRRWQRTAALIRLHRYWSVQQPGPFEEEDLPKPLPVTQTAPRF